MQTTNAPARLGRSVTSAMHATAGVDNLLELVLKTLDAAKAEDISQIDLRGKSSIGDHMVIASGRSQRHVGAIAEQLIQDLKEAGFGRISAEGLPHCDWVLLDAGDVIIHIFRPEVRAFYDLEKLWGTAPATHPPAALSRQN